ncbi:MAG: hypothetical protein WDN02_13435 [Methylovirgula sp.]|uniref:hypothetical protein n=1 Tax=Methylovirgula sp. TaxID=1978224 RepID=UPI0030764593
MAETSKIFSFFGPGVTQRGVLISGSLALAGMVLSFAPILPQPNLWQVLGTPAVAPAHASTPNSTWAGHLESPGTSGADVGASHALTSASYTTGFDSAAAAPLPAPSLKMAAVDPSACPNDLNCTFRSKAGATLPPPHARMASIGSSRTHAGAAHQDLKKPTGLAALLPSLPSTHTLLKPFAFVANTFGGLMHRL